MVNIKILLYNQNIILLYLGILNVISNRAGGDSFNLKFCFDLLFMSMFAYLTSCLYMKDFVKDRLECYIYWSWNYRTLWATISVRTVEPGSCAWTIITLKQWVPVLGP